MEKKELRRKTIAKLNGYIRLLETWNSKKDHEDIEDIDIHLMYNDIREFKQLLVDQGIDEF